MSRAGHNQGNWCTRRHWSNTGPLAERHSPYRVASGLNTTLPILRLY